MGVADQASSSTSTTNPAHLYPQSLQLKLYQAFIFSVPILFSIILLLLFYLFYLKRRRDSILLYASSLPSTNNPPGTSNSSTGFNHPNPLLPLPFEVELKEEHREKLPIVMFDEALRAKDSLCCVCLGDFELKEQLHQLLSCKHVFHMD